MIMIDNKFDFGQVVYLKTNRDQQSRMVTAIRTNINNSVTYCLTCGVTDQWHFECEISATKDVLTTLID